MINSQKKGKNYERDIAKLLSKAFGVTIARTPCSGGIHNFITSDLHCRTSKDTILKSLHIECKHQESLNMWKAYSKTKYLTPGVKIPLVIATKNHYPQNLVTLDLTDLIYILKELEEYRLEKFGKAII